jgi:cytoskeletal protein CcmA (bactofilin family)
MRPLVLLMMMSMLALGSATGDVDRPRRVERRLGNDLFAAGNSVSINQRVVGDLIAAGGDLDINTDVAGDAVVAGGTVHTRGNVEQSLYAAGGRLFVHGTVARNARIAGGQVEIDPRSEIQGNVSVAGRDIRMNGKVDGYLQSAGRHVYINGPVGGDVDATSNFVELGPDARIAGKLRYTSQQEIKQDTAARVIGGIERMTPAGGPPNYDALVRFLGWVWTLGFMILAAVVVAALPSVYSRVTSTLETRPGLSLALGVIGLVFVPAAALILIFSLIGMPLGILTMILFLAMLLLAYVATSATIGDWALRRFKPEAVTRTSWRVGATVLAILALGLIGRIPVLGGLVVFAALLVGLGALILQFRRAAPVATA